MSNHNSHCLEMGASPRYAYPQHVWSPAGGWWAQPATWKRNTAVVAAGAAVLIYAVARLSAQREERHREPKRRLLSTALKPE